MRSLYLLLKKYFFFSSSGQQDASRLAVCGTDPWVYNVMDGWMTEMKKKGGDKI